ncbi:bifunctional folylpolyglutamate synthase/dihydrofolate synthase [Alkalibacillus aidingensis]|uniref:bifunctional folylpolyglutamate synthase/dihydrofolate synthase n=1 Tax=Alkalibacillus aidingensis TaxID=2747607 RepID=UPI0016605A1B|nr:folylpolyglutamate synthase/dihydrofolate synthase family protein [Alkalibacillus aidingensis]
MNEQEAIDWIHQQLTFGIKPGLKRVEWLLEQLDRPHDELKLIHIAGTNGKGSTVTYLRNILQEHDYQVGTFTSPYIEKFNERISINGIPIPGSQLVELVQQIQPLCKQLSETDLGSPTEFEIITVMAFLHFKKEGVDYAIIEVGLGGRLDSTNVINPLLSIITTIGYDHMNILGDSLEQITYEKAGIIKKKTPVISGVQQSSAKQIIQKVAQENQSPLYQLGQEFKTVNHHSSATGEQFHYMSKKLTLDHLKITMFGRHQINNSALAIHGYLALSEIENFSYSKAAIKTGLTQSKWPGRFEYIQTEPDIVLDGAHNYEALETLVTTLNQRYRTDQIHILCSVVKNKPIEQMVKLLTKNYRHITITTFDFHQKYGYYELREKFEKIDILVERDWKLALEQLRDKLKADEVLVVTGSLYFISEVRQYLSTLNP